MANCLINLGLDLGVVRVLNSSEALDLDILQVLVLAVVPDPEESFLEELKLESWEVFLVTTQEDGLRFGSSILKGMPQ